MPSRKIGGSNRFALKVEKNEFAAGVTGRPVLWKIQPKE